VNLPLGEAIKRIFEQPAKGELRRVVLYVKPTPTVPPESAADKATEVPSILSSVLTAVNAPRAEGITGDVATIREHNLTVERQRAARLAMLRRQSDTGQLLVRARESFDAYVQLRSLSSVSNMMDRVRAYLPEGAIAQQAAIEAQLRQKRLDSLPTSHNEFGRASNDSAWAWGIASLEYAIAVFLGLIDTLLATSWGIEDAEDAAEGPRVALADARSYVYEVVALLGRLRAIDAVYWRHQTQVLRGQTDDLAAVNRWVIDSYDNWPQLASGTSPAFDRAIEDANKAFEPVERGVSADRAVVLENLRYLAERLAGIVNDALPSVLRFAEHYVDGIATMEAEEGRSLARAEQLARGQLSDLGVEERDRATPGWQTQIRQAATEAILQYLALVGPADDLSVQGTLRRLPSTRHRRAGSAATSRSSS
jgi:hypothetical protein